ncbi:AbrB family transcriptional regulator [Bacillus lacus]|uniref:AbrB family transcriptional regulator n=1 Tax=Metabacillus lacus TaxID=1983721 RepID=A0A7X2IW50_9BACI|nr:AbrB/MazE/SpoVT family DNA-binding domain-containing protein [Metabacillus lacus]MRX70877.1 AbrB family transcriptional regulator [Metabacillus lacus]
MKPLGIVRNVDKLGRIVLPKESRDIFGWEPGTPIEIMATHDGILLKAYKPEIQRENLIKALEQHKLKDLSSMGLIDEAITFIKTK